MDNAAITENTHCLGGLSVHTDNMALYKKYHQIAPPAHGQKAAAAVSKHLAPASQCNVLL